MWAMCTSNSWYRSWHTCVIATVEPEVHRSCVSVLCIVFSKAAPSKDGFHGTHGTPSGSATGECNLRKSNFGNLYLLWVQLWCHFQQSDSHFSALKCSIFITSPIQSRAPSIFSMSKVSYSRIIIVINGSLRQKLNLNWAGNLIDSMLQVPNRISYRRHLLTTYHKLAVAEVYLVIIHPINVYMATSWIFWPPLVASDLLWPHSVILLLISSSEHLD